MREHFPGSLPIPEIEETGNATHPLSATGKYSHPVLVEPRPWINLAVLQLAFSQFGKHKWPGPDGFQAIVLCHLPETVLKALIQLYTAIIDIQYTPSCGSEILFLPRPGKDDYTDKCAFGPISLMPFIFKALERLVKWHMEGHVKPFQPNQHAFRKGHCTENAPARMTDIIESSLSLGQIALVVDLDTKGAFENLTSTSIAKGMTAHDVDKDILAWVSNYLNPRYCKVKGSKQFFKQDREGFYHQWCGISSWIFSLKDFLTALSKS
jgi:hypothetical protein